PGVVGGLQRVERRPAAVLCARGGGAVRGRAGRLPDGAVGLHPPRPAGAAVMPGRVPDGAGIRGGLRAVAAGNFATLPPRGEVGKPSLDNDLPGQFATSPRGGGVGVPCPTGAAKTGFSRGILPALPFVADAP